MVSGWILCFCLVLVAVKEIASEDPNFTIVGGLQATKGQFPWQLQLKKYNQFICGAVLISPSLALTGAHCLGESHTVYTVTGGEHDTGASNPDRLTLTLSGYTMHPEFDEAKSGRPYDIAVLKINGCFPNNTYTHSISMAPSSSDFTGAACTISGWGRESADSSIPSVLRYVHMPIISNSECVSRWSGMNHADINSKHICVFKSGKSACSGDSGGPMVCNGLLAGITSWGIDTCSGLYPTVFTRVSEFLGFIAESL